MDKAIYSALDNLATFNINGFQNSVSRMINLVRNPAEEVPMKEGRAQTVEDTVNEKITNNIVSKAAKEAETTAKPTETPSSKINTATTQLGVEARRNFKKQPDSQTKDWADGVKKSREQQASLLYPPHQTIQ